MANSDSENNPYEAPTTVSAPITERKRYSVWWAVGGASWSIGLAFPIAATMALAYRFPIPFAGYRSGIDAMLPSMLAVVFYGILGGFILLGVTGILLGCFIALLPNNRRTKHVTLFLACATTTTVYLFVLAILDQLIGPW